MSGQVCAGAGGDEVGDGGGGVGGGAAVAHLTKFLTTNIGAKQKRKSKQRGRCPQ